MGGTDAVMVEDSWSYHGPGTFLWGRTVQHRLYGDDQYEGIGWRVIAWEMKQDPPRVLAYDRKDLDRLGLNWRPGGRGKTQHEFDPARTDIAVHLAFVRGLVPAYAYADWLEEAGVPLPPEAYAVLRGTPIPPYPRENPPPWRDDIPSAEEKAAGERTYRVG